LNPLKTVQAPLYLLWRPRDLLRLICWRFYRFLDAHHLLHSASRQRIDWSDQHDVMEKMWRPYFGHEVTNAQGLQEDTFPFVLRHTQLRPRQLIYVCNTIARRALQRGSFPVMSAEDIIAGARDAQTMLAQEVINSYSSVYPGVSRIVNALMRLPMVFSGSELDKRAKDTRSEWPPNAYSLANFRQLLAEMGIVGRVARVNERAGFVDAEFEYAMTERLIVSPREEYAIHPMFYRAFNITLAGHYRVMPFSAQRESEGNIRQYRPEVEVFLRLTRRAEKVDRAILAETFENVGPLRTLLASEDHQVIYGRRGTGKTHALLYLDQAARKRGDVSAYIDLRTIGSTTGLWANAELSVAERATRLLMDTFGGIHDALYDQLSTASGVELQKVIPCLNNLADAITEVIVSGTVETEAAQSHSATVGRKESMKATLAATSAAELHSGTETSSSEQSSTRTVQSGVQLHRVHIGRVSNCMRDLALAVAPRQIWILVDEWSVIPIELQPSLADLLRRCLFPLQRITVKIGSIEHRTHLQVTRGTGDYIGIELGADASADINLDNFMVYEQDPDRAVRFFQEMLFKHVKTLQADLPAERRFRTASELLRAFEHRAAFEEFVRAAEGVPRDAINILLLAAQEAYDSPISTRDVRVGARSWYQRDKESSAFANAQAKRLMNWIVDEIVGRRHTRGFLLPAETRHPLIDTLFDARLLHVLNSALSL
jgi:hypothetical protein